MDIRYLIASAPTLLVLYRGWWCPSSKSQLGEIVNDYESLSGHGLYLVLASVVLLMVAIVALSGCAFKREIHYYVLGLLSCYSSRRFRVAFAHRNSKADPTNSATLTKPSSVGSFLLSTLLLQENHT